MFEWCRLDINLKKTFVMFITNKRVKLPKTININGSEIQVVSSFKILGIIVENKLNFLEYFPLKNFFIYVSVLSYNFLETYKLFIFQHRLIHRVLLLTHKIINKTVSPIN